MPLLNGGIIIKGRGVERSERVGGIQHYFISIISVLACYEYCDSIININEHIIIVCIANLLILLYIIVFTLPSIYIVVYPT